MSIIGETVPNKSNYFDRDDVLEKWGFEGNHCHYCGIKNSELSGLLMQCGKCKKAYYCGMKCFNADLPEHQKFCKTKSITSEPKKGNFSLPDPSLKNIVKDASEVKGKFHIGLDEYTDQNILSKNDKSPKKDKKKKKDKDKTEKKDKDKTEKKDKKKKKKEDNSAKEGKPEAVSDAKIQLAPEKETAEPSEKASMGMFDQSLNFEDLEGKITDGLSNSKNNDDNMRTYTIRLADGSLPELSVPTYEEIELREVETSRTPRSNTEAIPINLRKTPQRGPSQFASSQLPSVDLSNAETKEKQGYDWEKPDWVHNRALRPTDVGEQIKTNGDIIKKYNIAELYDYHQKYSSHLPEWAMKKDMLRKTGLGDQIKNGIDLRSWKSSTLQNASMNSSLDYFDGKIGSNSSIDWEKPEWVRTNVLKKRGMKR